MKKISRLVSFVVLFFFVSVGLLLLRNYQIEAGVKAYKEENGTGALEKLKPLAYLGDKTAQMIIGSIYAYGVGGVQKNDSEAIYWFRRCGAIGVIVVDVGVDPAAPHELNVAKAYANGSEGIKVDIVESEKWLRLAAKGGSKEAAAMLMKGNKNDNNAN